MKLTFEGWEKGCYSGWVKLLAWDLIAQEFGQSAF